MFRREQELFEENLEKRNDELERRSIELSSKEHLHQEKREKFDEEIKSKKVRYENNGVYVCACVI